MRLRCNNWDLYDTITWYYETITEPTINDLIQDDYGKWWRVVMLIKDRDRHLTGLTVDARTVPRI